MMIIEINDGTALLIVIGWSVLVYLWGVWNGLYWTNLKEERR
jgi:hypothetical protein